jgi:hypothetical protein
MNVITEQAEYQIYIAGLTNSDLLDTFERVSALHVNQTWALVAIRTEMLARMSS